MLDEHSVRAFDKRVERLWPPSRAGWSSSCLRSRRSSPQAESVFYAPCAVRRLGVDLVLDSPSSVVLSALDEGAACAFVVRPASSHR
jgi:hypothetical protein